MKVRPASDLETLFLKEGPRIWRALFAYTADRDVASDAVAEAFAQALARGSELRSPERWVWKVAFRVAAGEMKDRSRREPPSPAVSAYELPEPQHDLVVALRSLTANQRAALVLRHYAGYFDTGGRNDPGMLTALTEIPQRCSSKFPTPEPP
ncbi:MAG: RNA polymerase sigma factor [Actinomycetota bacterium]